jgi:hypothetical protein
MKLEPRILEGRHVRLEPVREEDREGMRALLASDADNWRMQTVNPIGDGFEPYWRAMIEEPARITLAIRDAGTGALAGTSSFFLIDARHRTL